MYNTLNDALKSSNYMRVLADRAMAAAQDEIMFLKYGFLRIEETLSPTIKTFYGYPNQVEIATEVGQFADAKRRTQNEMTPGTLEVGYFSDQIPTSEVMVEKLHRILQKSNGNITDANITEFEAYMTGNMGDLRVLTMAPLLGADFMLGSLLSEGTIKTKDKDGNIITAGSNLTGYDATSGSTPDRAIWLRDRIDSMKVKPATIIMNGPTLDLIMTSPSLAKYMVVGANYRMEGTPFYSATALQAFFADRGYNIEVIVENKSYNVGAGVPPVKFIKDGIVTFIPSREIGTLEMYRGHQWTITPDGANRFTSQNGLILNEVKVTENSTLISRYWANYIVNATLPNNIIRCDISLAA